MGCRASEKKKKKECNELQPIISLESIIFLKINKKRGGIISFETTITVILTKTTTSESCWNYSELYVHISQRDIY
jgi:hypothetical protein